MNYNPISSSLEDYLKSIYQIYSKQEKVGVTDIATDLNVKKPSVNKAIKLLKEEGLVEHEQYGKLTLTERGIITAKHIIKRHDIIKKFLKDVLKIDSAIAEKEACMIEHSLSCYTMTRLEKYLESLN